MIYHFANPVKSKAEDALIGGTTRGHGLAGGQDRPPHQGGMVNVDDDHGLQMQPGPSAQRVLSDLHRSADKHIQRSLFHAIAAHHNAEIAHIREARAHLCEAEPYLRQESEELWDNRHEVWAHLRTAHNHYDMAAIHEREKRRLLQAQAAANALNAQ